MKKKQAPCPPAERPIAEAFGVSQATAFAIMAFHDWYVLGTREGDVVEKAAEQIPTSKEARIYVKETLRIIREHPYRKGE